MLSFSCMLLSFNTSIIDFGVYPSGPDIFTATWNSVMIQICTIYSPFSYQRFCITTNSIVLSLYKNLQGYKFSELHTYTWNCWAMCVGLSPFFWSFPIVLHVGHLCRWSMRSVLVCKDSRSSTVLIPHPLQH